MTEANNAVEIRNLTKLYGGNKALNNVSFDVRKGEIMGFLGPNGAGKSTTMNIICGCISANEGNVSVCGCDVLENPKIVKGKIGYLPENPPLYFDMTVQEYLNFVFELKKVKFDKKKHISEIMELVKISDMKNRMIKNLSKGYKQRVGLAQALIGDPEVLILDEPTVGLDPKQIIEIRNVIKEIGKQRTIILSTHILQEVEAVCDRVTIISHGSIVAQNTIEGLEEETGGKDKFILTVLASCNRTKSVIERVDGVIDVKRSGPSRDDVTEFIVEQAPGSDIRLALTKTLADENIAIASLRSATLTLEEIFIKLTSQDIAAPAETEEIAEKDFSKQPESPELSEYTAEEERENGSNI
ncbi:MAG: ATP-binding cassette domain-containing protein [Ruminococcaceae bacterium]|nr:ATP-binding cassette domain-containing protein [Oscillospiraceae bacterium]